MGLIDWIALSAGWKNVDALAKPATMGALFAVTWLFPFDGGVPAAIPWIRVGILFSLLGDVLLLPAVDRFIAGLSAFLFGHLSYIIALNQIPLPINIQTVFLVIIVVGITAVFSARLMVGLKTGNNVKLQKPVLAYSIAITVMLASGWTTILRPGWPKQAAWLVAIGATAFTLSDTLLAWNRFVSPLPRSRLIVRVPYHMGQFLLALGAALS